MAPIVEGGLSAARWSWPRTVPTRRPRRSGPATWWSPTGPTPASAAPSAPAATGPIPLGMAIRGYYDSPRHDEPWIESWLDIRDKAGNVLPGYGWIFPVGDGRVNVGIGLLSTFNQWKAVNTTHLMESFVEWRSAVVGARPETCCGPPDGRPPADGHCRSGPTPGPPTCSSATPAGPSTRSTARASPTPTRPGRMAADAVTWPSRPATAWPCRPTPSRARGRLRPVLQGGPGRS